MKAILTTILVVGAVALLWTVPAQAADDSALIKSKLDMAIDDEYHARAMYAAVIEQFGEVRPFSQIIRAEERHIAALVRLYERYNLEVLADPYTEVEYSFTSLDEAARQARDAEIANAALYDELLLDVTDPEVIRVFENLQWASQERHLPAFERYLNGTQPGCCGNGMGNRANR